jgi:hypothetical protein
MTATDHDEIEKWREANPEAALAEAISVAIGCILTYESDEVLRKQAVGVLIECHRRALAGFVPVRPRLH